MTAARPRVDLGAAIRSIRHPLARMIPARCVDWIARALGQEELERCLAACERLEGFAWAQGVLEHFGIRVEAQGEEHVARAGRAVFVPNHPLGGLDGLAVLTVLGRHYPEARSLSSSYLMSIPNVRSFIIPVGDGYLDAREFARRVDDLYASEVPVLCFAAGRVAHRRAGRIVDPPWTKSFVTKAVRHGRAVVPVFVDAHNSDAYYRTHGLRTLLSRLTGLKLERYAILRETFRHHGEVFRLNFGASIPAATFDGRRDADGWAQRLRAHVHAMGLRQGVAFDPAR